MYKNHLIERHLSGWYSSLTNKGIVKSDTLKGVKQLINQSLWKQ